jgi:hypothetical protein
LILQDKHNGLGIHLQTTFLSLSWKVFKNVVKTWGSTCLNIFLKLDGMNIIGIGSKAFAFPQFNMLKSVVQQFLRLVFAKKNQSQSNINPKSSGLPYRCTHNILVHNKKHWIWWFLFTFYRILSSLWQSIIASSLTLVSIFF